MSLTIYGAEVIGTIEGVYFGTTPITAIYQGSTQVFG